jgi:RNA recognition motif-containing protein
VVEFQTAEDAKTAIRKMNDVVLRGRPVFVREDRESGERIGVSGRIQSSRSADLAVRQVFVGNVSE